jgi:hypothetical protein
MERGERVRQAMAQRLRQHLGRQRAAHQWRSPQMLQAGDHEVGGQLQAQGVARLVEQPAHLRGKSTQASGIGLQQLARREAHHAVERQAVAPLGQRQQRLQPQPARARRAGGVADAAGMNLDGGQRTGQPPAPAGR